MLKAPRHARLGPALFAAGGLAFLSALLWVVAMVAAWTATCPGGRYEPTGIDKGLSAWPPGAQCPGHDGAQFVFQPHPWLKWLSVAVAVAAVFVFVTGMVTAIRDLRRASPRLPDRRVSAAL
jgi:hypothetical protein